MGSLAENRKKGRALRHLLLPLLLLTVGLSLGAAHCATTIPVAIPLYPKKNEKKIRSVLEGQKNVAILAQRAAKAATKSSRKSKKGGNYTEEWLPSLEGALRKEVSQLGFYNLVDISSRKERLQELVFSQSGVTAESLEIGRELEVGTFLFLRATSDPGAKCKIEKVSSAGMTALSVVTAVAISSLTNQEAKVKTVTAPTGVLYLTVAVEGRLTNVETGRSLSYFYNEPYRSESDFGSRSCVAADKVMSIAVQRAAKQIADNLSPSIIRISAPLMDETKGFREPLKGRIAARLENGNHWAQDGDMKSAAEQWEKALKESDGRSGSALWNLGIYYWQEARFNDADGYFRKIISDHPEVLDGRKRKLLAQFNEQKEIAQSR